MRKVVAGEYVSLDGGFDAGWTGQAPALAPTHELTGRYLNDPEVGQVVGSLIAANDTLLLGRVTYEGFAGFFQGATGDVADQMNAIPKFVLSSTLEKADWHNSTIIDRELADRISELERQPGRTIGVSGSATLVRWLLQEQLLDELHLLIVPVTLHSGKPVRGGVRPDRTGPRRLHGTEQRCRARDLRAHTT
jgi:dihydrofolate reductase